jgi:hypothetical protein
MSGARLLASAAKDEAHEVVPLPFQMLKESGAKTITKKSILHKDREVQQQKAVSAEAKHARRTGIPFTLDRFKEKAASTTVGKDLLLIFYSPSSRLSRLIAPRSH